MDVPLQAQVKACSLMCVDAQTLRKEQPIVVACPPVLSSSEVNWRVLSLDCFSNRGVGLVADRERAFIAEDV